MTMINLQRLTIKKGDIVKRKYTGEDGDYEPFIVDRIEINGDTLQQVVYPEYGLPINVHDVEIVSKDDSSDESDKNRVALEHVLNSIYGDKWDIQEIRDQGTNVSVYTIYTKYLLIIHYPELTIKNSNGSEHFIRDLYIGIPVTKEYKLGDSSILGTRTSATIPERDSSYSHSHLSNPPYGKFSTFCTGGDILDEAIAQARATTPFINPLVYEQFFELLNTFVEWESLEGGPYKRISSIGSNSRRSRAGGLIPPDGSSLLVSTLDKYGYQLPVTIDFNLPEDRGYYNLLSFNVNEFKRIIKECLVNNLEELKGTGIPFLSILCIKEDRSYFLLNSFSELQTIIRNNNEVTDDDEEKFLIEEIGDSYITFRGNRIKKKEYIYKKDSSVNVKLDNIDVPTSLIDNLITNLKLKFYEQFFREGDKFFEELKSSND